MASYTGSNGPDSLSGAEGNDTISGLEGEDTLAGGNGADTLAGGDDRDFMYGEDGDDLLIGGLGNDRIDGGAGSDTVSYAYANSRVWLDLGAGQGNDRYGDTDRLVSVENVIGSAYDDTLTGDAGDNILQGGQGYDILDGGDGFDIASFADATSWLWLHLDRDYQTSMGGGLGNDELRNIEGVIAGAYGDNIQVGGAAFYVDAGAGDDWVYVNTDAGLTAHITLGAGRDTLVAQTEMAGQAVVSDFAPGGGGDVLYVRDLLYYSTDWDQAVDPFVSGHLRLMQDGDDTLVQVDDDGAGAGAFRTVFRLEDTDRLALSADNFTDGFVPISRIVGDATDEVFTTGPDIGQPATIDGGDGADELRLTMPVSGSQTYATFTVSGDGRSILVDMDADGTTDLTVTNVEKLTILGGSSRLTGDFSATGLARDGLVFIGDDAGWNALDASGMVEHGSITAYGHEGNESLAGAAGNDWLEPGWQRGGGSWLNGGAGDDTIVGGGANSYIRGGDGVDTLRLAGRFSDYVMTFGGADGVVSQIHSPVWEDGIGGLYTLSGADVERFQFADRITDAYGRTLQWLEPRPDPGPPPSFEPTPGGDRLNLNESQLLFDAAGGDDYVVGGSGANTILGGEGDDSLFGGAGDDVLDGGTGSNYLRGGEGLDSLGGGEAFDDLHGGVGDDTVRGGAGGDWVVGGQGGDMLFGDAGDDVTLGNLGEDILDGGEGNDVVRGGQGDDSVQGGAGDDWLAGDRGDDTLAGGAGADTFHSWAQAGIDRVLDFSFAEGDRVNLLAGTTYSVAQVGADTVIAMTGGAEMTLVGVQLSTLTEGWITVG